MSIEALACVRSRVHERAYTKGKADLPGILLLHPYMPRFYCDLPLQTSARIALPENIVRHLHVLRLEPGHPIVLFNGRGGEFAATLTALDKRSAMAEIGDYLARDSELPYQLALAQGLPEASKMDWIIEKAVELGISAIQPLAAQRSVVKLTPERAAKKQQHWQGIIIAASEQSGRTRIAALNDVVELGRWSVPTPDQNWLLLTPRADRSLADWAVAHPPRDTTLIVGPEGGFSDHEENLLTSRGVIPLAMGPRILRTETAGLAALAILNATWGQM